MARATVKKKTPAKKAPKKKTPAKKAAVKKAAPKKKAPAKKTAVKKTAPKKKAAPKKKVAVKKPAAPAKKVAAKKPAPKKAPAKKPAPKKAPAKKVAVKKPAPVKAEPKKAPATKNVSPPRPSRPAPRPSRPAPRPEPQPIIVMPPPPKTPLPKKIGDFANGDYVVYPTHGVGQIMAIDDQEVAGHILRLFVIHFDKEKMTLSIPVNKAEETGLRKLSTRPQLGGALDVLRGRSRVSRAMWSRRAQEYEAKINSGDPIAISEVVRDLHRNAGQPDQSYSERQIYEAALERLAREVAAVEKLDYDAAIVRIEQILNKEE